MPGVPQPINHGPEPALCKGCGAKIFFIKNENGKSEPFDRKVSRVLALSIDAVPDVSALRQTGKWVVAPAHLPHFVTCPNAQQFRRTRR